jgi:hypothetical protein
MSLDEDLKKEIESASVENLEKLDDQAKTARETLKKQRAAELQAILEAAQSQGLVNEGTEDE